LPTRAGLHIREQPELERLRLRAWLYPRGPARDPRVNAASYGPVVPGPGPDHQESRTPRRGRRPGRALEPLDRERLAFVPGVLRVDPPEVSTRSILLSSGRQVEEGDAEAFEQGACVLNLPADVGGCIVQDDRAWSVPSVQPQALQLIPGDLLEGFSALCRRLVRVRLCRNLSRLSRTESRDGWTATPRSQASQAASRGIVHDGPPTSALSSSILHGRQVRPAHLRRPPAAGRIRHRSRSAGLKAVQCPADRYRVDLKDRRNLRNGPALPRQPHTLQTHSCVPC
jgi:hypothetical protein